MCSRDCKTITSPVKQFYVSGGIGYKLCEKSPYSTLYTIKDTTIRNFGKGATQAVATQDKKELKEQGFCVRVVKYKPGKHYVYYASKEYVNSIKSELKKTKRASTNKLNRFIPSFYFFF